MTIGARLREERERLGMAQPAFAALAGSSKRSQIKYEQDEAAPNALALAAWAAAGMDVLYVVTGERQGETPLKPDEKTLLAYWRKASKEVRRAALGALVGAEPLVPDSVRQPSGNKLSKGKVVRLVAVKKPDPKR